MKKLIVAIVILVLIVVGVGAAFAFRGAGEEQAIEVQMQEATLGALTVTVTAPGEIEADTQVNISARTSAAIVALPFEEGDIVTKGDENGEGASVLVQLDDTDARARVRASKANRTGAAANLAVARARITAAKARQAVNEALLADAERDLERQQSLFDSEDVSQKAVDSARTLVEQLRAQVETEQLTLSADDANLAVLEAQIEAADAEIERAEEELSYTTIRSPIDGVVTVVNAEVGEIVITGTMNNPGTVILEVADLSEMICNAEIDEASVAAVEIGQTATVRSAAYDDAAIKGTVRSVALAKTTAQSGFGSGSSYYEVEILLDPEQTAAMRVFSGLTADVEIETRAFDGVLRVPSQAVVGRRVDELPQEMRDLPEVRNAKEFTPVVFRVIDGKTKITPVRVGPSDLLNTVIESGLEPGSTIVTGPFKVLETIKDGQGVKNEGTEGSRDEGTEGSER